MAEEEQISSPAPPVWCVVANVREEIPQVIDGTFTTRRGTGKFHGGAKVYLARVFWGPGAEDVTVIGHYRGHNFTTCSVRTRYLTNWRVELVYSPTIVERLNAIPDYDQMNWNGSPEAKAQAEELAVRFQRYSDELQANFIRKHAPPSAP